MTRGCVGLYVLMLTRSKAKALAMAKAEEAAKEDVHDTEACLADVIGIIENHAAVYQGSALDALQSLAIAHSSLSRRYVKVVSERWKQMDMSCFKPLYDIFHEMPNPKVMAETFYDWTKFCVEKYHNDVRYLFGYGNAKYIKARIRLNPNPYTMDVSFTMLFALDRHFKPVSKYCPDYTVAEYTVSARKTSAYGVYMDFEWSGERTDTTIGVSNVNIKIVPVMSLEYSSIFMENPTLITPLLQCVRRFYQPIQEALWQHRPHVRTDLLMTHVVGLTQKEKSKFVKKNKENIDRFLASLL